MMWGPWCWPTFSVAQDCLHRIHHCQESRCETQLLGLLFPHRTANANTVIPVVGQVLAPTSPNTCLMAPWRISSLVAYFLGSNQWYLFREVQTDEKGDGHWSSWFLQFSHCHHILAGTFRIRSDIERSTCSAKVRGATTCETCFTGAHKDQHNLLEVAHKRCYICELEALITNFENLGMSRL